MPGVCFKNGFADPSCRSAEAEQAAEKVSEGEKNIPRRLKPFSNCGIYGTSKLVPFQNSEFFRSL
jgi:hypothetical protein